MSFRSLIPFARPAHRGVAMQQDDPFFSLHRELHRAFDDVFDHFNVSPSFFGKDGFGEWEVSPSIDVKETKEDFKISVELPGVDENDIDLQLSDNVLTIRGEKVQEEDREDKDKDFYVTERSFGSFYRSIPLPFKPEEGAIDAVFKKGVLTITIPKTGEELENTRKIRISS